MGRVLLSRFPSDGGVRSTGPGVVSLEPLVVQDVATKFLASVQRGSLRSSVVPFTSVVVVHIECLSFWK